MVTLEQAREWLRIDGTDNDAVIEGLLKAAPEYITTATGVPRYVQRDHPLADTITKFLLTLWYNAEQAEAAQLQRTIDNLLKALTTIRPSYEE